MNEKQPPKSSNDNRAPEKPEELHTTKPEVLGAPTDVHEASKAGKGLGE